MEPMMELVNALNGVAQAIDRLSQNTAEKVVSEFEPVIEAEPVKKELTLTDVRCTLAEKSRAGFKAEVKELLQKHGADKLSDILASEYEALLKEAELLGN